AESSKEKINNKINEMPGSAHKEIAAENITKNNINPVDEDKDNEEIIFSFSVCGDNRPADDYLPQPDVFLKLLNLIKNTDSAFHMTTGDIINGGTEDPEIIKRQFLDYLEAVKILPLMNFVSPGNHDTANDTSRKYFIEMINKKVFNEAIINKIPVFITDSNNDILLLADTIEGSEFKNLYYYFIYDGIYFIVLNAFEKGYWGAVKENQLAWLEKVFEKTQNEAVFVFIHTPPYSVLNPDTITDGSTHVAFSSKENQNYIRELIKKYKVDAVFSGHEHLYNKQYHDGTTFVITALSGEYPFVPEDEGGFYHYIKIDVKHSSWIFNVIDSNGCLYTREEIAFN
ncbi:MAG: metallophosphoesterase, partial [Actinobacteria bacterium]|nr:metallophosphoesterase [Actinomycetota bacterium]